MDLQIEAAEPKKKIKKLNTLSERRRQNLVHCLSDKGVECCCEIKSNDNNSTQKKNLFFSKIFQILKNLVSLIT